MMIAKENTETPAGAEASVRPRSALAYGGSPAARGKRSIFRSDRQTCI